MNIFTPAEFTQNYSQAGKVKAEKPFHQLLLLAILAGFFIAVGAAVTNTAVHSITDVSTTRIVSGLLFPFGLGMVMLTGAELFTGNTMISISVLNQDTGIRKMFRNWTIVYLGNFFGAIMLAAGCAWFGQMNYSSSGLAVYSIKIATSKCAMTFENSIIMGIFCNILVCVGILCSLSAKDATGRILGAYIPVAFFVICGFEHCVANMYYVPAGIFAMRVPKYAAMALDAGIEVSQLTWGNFFLRNLLPVTLGNILGGVCMGVVMWVCNIRPSK
jgi:formate/nitrite transporter